MSPLEYSKLGMVVLPEDEAMRLAASRLRNHLMSYETPTHWQIVEEVIRSLDAAGWACVPKEATQEMRESDSASDPNSHRGFLSAETLAHVWRCMMRAAPRLTGGKS